MGIAIYHAHGELLYFIGNPTRDKPSGRKTFSSLAKFHFAREEKVFLPLGLSLVGQKFMPRGIQKCFLPRAHGELLYSHLVTIVLNGKNFAIPEGLAGGISFQKHFPP